MSLDLRYPALSDLRRAARRRIPHFAFEYLDSATGTEKAPRDTRAALDAIHFLPDILQGTLTPDLRTTILGQTYDLPIGIAPIGMSGMIWPGAEVTLAQAAVRGNIPYCQSTVAAATPEQTAPHIGANGWFQHYPVKDPAIRRDMLERIAKAGFRTLVVTVDVPGESRRERQRRAAVAMPPKVTPGMVWSMLLHPHWTIAMARAGRPRMPFPESYVPGHGRDAFVHAGRLIRGWPDWRYIDALRAEWDGPLIIKGILNPEDAPRLLKAGADALWVSSHAGRQFEAGPPAIDQLPKLRDTVGPDVPLIYDSGVEGGLDVVRALAKGADFVFLGKAFHFALAALGAKGVDHLLHIFCDDMAGVLTHLGVDRAEDAAKRLI